MSQTNPYPSVAYVPTDWLCLDGLKTFISVARFQADALTTILEFQIDALNQFSLLWDAPYSELVDELYLAPNNELGEERHELCPMPTRGSQGPEVDLRCLSG